MENVILDKSTLGTEGVVRLCSFLRVVPCFFDVSLHFFQIFGCAGILSNFPSAPQNSGR